MILYKITQYDIKRSDPCKPFVYNRLGLISFVGLTNKQTNQPNSKTGINENKNEGKQLSPMFKQC